MFYQEHVPEKHQSFLRFIWCEQNNLGCAPSDYQMFFHVFGGTFSHSSKHQRNIEEVTPGAAQTLQRSFYADDILKS